MKKVLYVFALAGLFGFASCDSPAEERAEERGEAMEEAAEEHEDAVEERADEMEDAAEEMDDTTAVVQ